MLGLLARRAFGLVSTLLVVSFLIFLAMNVLPGDPAAVMLGTSAQPDTLAALRTQMGLDAPMLVRFGRWIGGALTGDFGISYTYGVPVAGLVGERLLVTLPLAALSTLIAILVSIPLGVTAAANQGRWRDGLVTVFTQGSVALPNFWIGLLLILVFSVSLGWMPAGGFPGWQAGLGPALAALLLPAIALALPQAGILTRVTRTAVLDILNEDFVRTARAKGLDRRRALWRHVVPNALLPVVTMLGLQFTYLVAGSVLVENVFGLPGLGRLAYQAFSQRDLIVMQSVVLFLAGLVIVVNFLVDMAYLALDPRLRSGAAQ
ncbi:ABC transporter permease [Aureimonas ureilytica]|uniref:ABC transporter permease n=1 Tax=Aureimonas ureilytica TaxID=401562 RepID=UPI00037B1D14|nr:ABC transporter permease [Aureimonas ureilytica]